MYKNKKVFETKILIVDDLESNIIFLEHLIQMRYDVTILKATSGIIALELLKKHEVALILLDIMMPGMNGFAVIKELKENNLTQDIPIIIVSGLGDNIKEVEKGISLGAVDFITKPVNHEVLLGKVKIFINLFQQKKNLSVLIDRLEKVNLRLTESEKRFKKLSLAAVDAIIVVDSKNEITFWNSSAQKIFGYRKEEIIYEPIETIIKFPDYFNMKETGLPELFEKKVLSVSNKVYEMDGIKNNQSIISLELSFSVFSLNLDRHAVIIARDITRRKRLEREALKAKELRESNKTMKQFVDNINHELLTPVNIIKGLSSGLLSYNIDNLSPKQVESIKHIKENSEKLNGIVENILALKNPNKNKSTKIDLNVLVNRIEHYAKNKLASKQVEFKLVKENISDIEFYADRQKLEHVLINLVENSIKFTEKGQILLKATGDENNVKFSLSDTGIGIDENHLNSIMKKFQQIDGSSERKYGGLGIGLTVIKKYVKQMGGTFQIISKKDVGTRIKIVIPSETESSGGILSIN